MVPPLTKQRVNTQPDTRKRPASGRRNAADRLALLPAVMDVLDAPSLVMRPFLPLLMVEEVVKHGTDTGTGPSWLYR